MKQPKIIIGAPDALTAHLCRTELKANYIWASSLILSALAGKKDDGIEDISQLQSYIASLVKGGEQVIVDFDIAGRDMTEVNKNLLILSELRVAGVSIEDEGYPKINAMLGAKRTLIDPRFMAQKLAAARHSLGDDALVIGRIHSYIAGESVEKAQERVNVYERAGANAICVHYTGPNWSNYLQYLHQLRINAQKVLILPKVEKVPKELLNEPWDYVIWPNQIYRLMLKGVEALNHRADNKDWRSWQWPGLSSTVNVFSLVETINKQNDAKRKHGAK